MTTTAIGFFTQRVKSFIVIMIKTIYYSSYYMIIICTKAQLLLELLEIRYSQ